MSREDRYMLAIVNIASVILAALAFRACRSSASAMYAALYLVNTMIVYKFRYTCKFAFVVLGICTLLLFASAILF